MFGIFKKKPKDSTSQEGHQSAQQEDYGDNAPAPAASPMQQGPMPSALAWDASIAQVQQEFSQVLAQAVASSAPFIDAIQTDYGELERHWAPMDRELDNAKDAISRIWNSTQRVLMREHEEEEAREFQANKRDFGRLELEIAHQAALREVRARASQVMLNFALHSDARSRQCTSCGQAITSVLIDRAQNIACPACQAPQTVEPGMAFRVFATVGATWVGQWDGFPYWATMVRLELQIQNFRNTKDVPMAMLHEYNNAAYHYWSLAFGSEAQLVPAMAGHMQNKIDGQMKPVRKLLRSHWQWREMEEGQAPV